MWHRPGKTCAPVFQANAKAGCRSSCALLIPQQCILVHQMCTAASPPRFSRHRDAVALCTQRYLLHGAALALQLHCPRCSLLQVISLCHLELQINNICRCTREAAYLLCRPSCHAWWLLTKLAGCRPGRPAAILALRPCRSAIERQRKVKSAEHRHGGCGRV